MQDLLQKTIKQQELLQPTSDPSRLSSPFFRHPRHLVSCVR